MTIEEAIDVLEYLKTQNSQLKSIDVAISTMRTYQRIEQILDDCDLEAWEVLEKIKEVVADAKTD